MVQLSATRCSCIVRVSLVRFAAITLCVVLLLNECLFRYRPQSGNFWIHSHTGNKMSYKQLYLFAVILIAVRINYWLDCSVVSMACSSVKM